MYYSIYQSNLNILKLLDTKSQLLIYLGWICSLAFSGDGRYLASGSYKTIHLIDLQSKTIYHRFYNIHESNN